MLQHQHTNHIVFAMQKRTFRDVRHAHGLTFDVALTLPKGPGCQKTAALVIGPSGAAV